MHRAPTLCDRAPGLCCGDERCHDQLCPGHPFMQGIPRAGRTFQQEHDEAGDKVLQALMAGLVVLIVLCIVLADYFA